MSAMTLSGHSGSERRETLERNCAPTVICEPTKEVRHESG